MMPFLLGPISGKIFDEGGFHKLEAVGCFIFAFSHVSSTLNSLHRCTYFHKRVFMLSLCQPDHYYQVRIPVF